MVFLCADPAPHASLLFWSGISKCPWVKGHYNDFSWHDQGVWSCAPWTAAIKNQTIWVSRSAVLMVRLLQLCPLQSSQYQLVVQYKIVSSAATIPALHERRLLRSMPQRTFLIRPRHQGSQFFRAIFPTTNHGQQHGGCKLTVRVVWVMCDAIFCHGGLYMHLLVIYIRSCFLWRDNRNSADPSYDAEIGCFLIGRVSGWKFVERS